MPALEARFSAYASLNVGAINYSQKSSFTNSWPRYRLVCGRDRLTQLFVKDRTHLRIVVCARTAVLPRVPPRYGLRRRSPFFAAAVSGTGSISLRRQKRGTDTARPTKCRYVPPPQARPLPRAFFKLLDQVRRCGGMGVRRGVCSVRRPGWIPVSIARGGGALSVRRRYFLGQVRRCGGNGETANKGRWPHMATDPCQKYRCASELTARQGQAVRGGGRRRP